MVDQEQSAGLIAEKMISVISSYKSGFTKFVSRQFSLGDHQEVNAANDAKVVEKDIKANKD